MSLPSKRDRRRYHERSASASDTLSLMKEIPRNALQDDDLFDVAIWNARDVRHHP